jgi:DNA polymerase (family 10)
MTNEQIARKLRDQASELARGGNNLYRVRAFRQAAMAVLGLTDEVESLVALGGPKALEQVPGIGKSLAETITGYVGDESRAVEAVAAHHRMLY